MIKKVLKLVLLASVASMSSIVASGAEDSGLTYSPFTTQTVEMAIATDKAGHKMHVIRMKDGSMMALVPAIPLYDLMKTTQDDYNHP